MLFEQELHDQAEFLLQITEQRKTMKHQKFFLSKSG